MVTMIKPHSKDREDRKIRTGNPRLVPVRRVQWKRVLTGAAITLLGGGTAAWAAGHEEERSPVVVAGNDVAAGDPLSSGDLEIVHVPAGEELDLLTVDQALDGRAAVPLKAGSVLTSGMLADTTDWPGRGEAVVAVDAPPGVLPESARVGAPLSVFGEEAADGVEARLHSLGEEGEHSGSRIIELLVDASEAAVVSRAVQEDGARLVLTEAR